MHEPPHLVAHAKLQALDPLQMRAEVGALVLVGDERKLFAELIELHEIAPQELDPVADVAAGSGSGHAQEVYRSHP